MYIASRNKERIELAIESLKAETGREALCLEMDLSRLQSVRKAAKEFLRYVLLFEADVSAR